MPTKIRRKKETQNRVRSNINYAVPKRYSLNTRRPTSKNNALICRGLINDNKNGNTFNQQVNLDLLDKDDPQKVNIQRKIVNKVNLYCSSCINNYLGQYNAAIHAFIAYEKVERKNSSYPNYDPLSSVKVVLDIIGATPFLSSFSGFALKVGDMFLSEMIKNKESLSIAKKLLNQSSAFIMGVSEVVENFDTMIKAYDVHYNVDRWKEIEKEVFCDNEYRWNEIIHEFGLPRKDKNHKTIVLTDLISHFMEERYKNQSPTWRGIYKSAGGYSSSGYFDYRGEAVAHMKLNLPIPIPEDKRVNVESYTSKEERKVYGVRDYSKGGYVVSGEAKKAMRKLLKR